MMPKGKVKLYLAERGYGFIIDLESGRQLTFYANYTDLKKGEVLKEGQKVEYELENNHHRDSAVNVRIL